MLSPGIVFMPTVAVPWVSCPHCFLASLLIGGGAPQMHSDDGLLRLRFTVLGFPVKGSLTPTRSISRLGDDRGAISSGQMDPLRIVESDEVARKERVMNLTKEKAH